MRSAGRFLWLALRPIPQLPDLYDVTLVILWLIVPSGITIGAALTGFTPGIAVGTAALLGVLCLLFAVAGVRLQAQIDKRHGQLATLKFGEPNLDEASEVEWWKHGARFSLPVHLWRLTLTNQQPDTVAKNVRVKVLNMDPTIGLRSFDVHQTHDDHAPFRQERNIRHNEPIDFDIIGKHTGGDQIYLYRSDLASESFVYWLSKRETEALRAALYANGTRITLKAFPDPPAIGDEVSLRACVDDGGQLRVIKEPTQKLEGSQAQAT